MLKNLNLWIIVVAVAIMVALLAGCKSTEDKSFNVDLGGMGGDFSTGIDPVTGTLMPAVKMGDVSGNVMTHKIGDGDNIYFRQDKSFWGSEIGSTVFKCQANAKKKITISSVAQGTVSITIDEATSDPSAESDSSAALPVAGKARPPVIVSGQVIDVHDGDTCKVACADGITRTIRLYGIDAPELKQPCGMESRDKLSAMIMDKSVELQITGKDDHGERDDARIIVDNIYVNLSMVAQGYAWAYPQYLKAADKPAFAAAQEHAKKVGSGLWAQTDPVAPWDYRKGIKK